ncbi:MAG: acyloxyacyl hydrolase [Alphaproteobacteria bacterium]|nr:acyloxyacyl hydrolase [Alphaproteobacteria bacterium]
MQLRQFVSIRCSRCAAAPSPLTGNAAIRGGLTALAAVFLSAAPAMAKPAPSATPHYLTVGVGAFEVLRSDYTSGEFRLEYRAGEFWWHVAPMIGLMANTDGGFYGYGGFHANIELGYGFRLVPNVAVGLYEEGSSRDLGGPVEFRSGLELNYKLPNEALLGVAFSHMSNASIYEHNPGQESLVVLYSHPLQW